MPPHVSYIVPSHNSAAVIEGTVEAIAKRFADTPAEIVVVENGSTDSTREILKRLVGEWPNHGPDLKVLTSAKGLGAALKAGVLASSGRVVVTNADDLPFGFDDYDAAEDLDLSRVKIVIGSKAHRESDIGRSFARSVMSFGYRSLVKMTLGLKTGDPQGIYVMDGDWARSVAEVMEETGYLYTTEVAYAAELSGLRPVEVPVRLRRQDHLSRINPVQDAVQMAKGLMRIRQRREAIRADLGIAP